MQDKVTQVLETVNETWGPLVLRGSEDALDCVKQAIKKNVKDVHISHAIFSLVMLGLEASSINLDDQFITQKTIVDILQGHIDCGTTLYAIQGIYAHPTNDPEVAGYCEHAATPMGKRICGDFDEVVNDAHEMLTALIDNAPDNMTDCEVKLSMIDDSGLIDMGHWVWNRRQAHTFWVKPTGRQ